MTWVGRGKAVQGRRKPPPLVLRRYLRNGPAILAVGLHALPSRVFAGPSNLILSLSHIGYLLIKDKLGSSQISRSHRQVTCVSVPLYTPIIFTSKAAMPACKSKKSYLDVDRVTQPMFHAVCQQSLYILKDKNTCASPIYCKYCP